MKSGEMEWNGMDEDEDEDEDESVVRGWRERKSETSAKDERDNDEERKE
jgi:hypothetical protein